MPFLITITRIKLAGSARRNVVFTSGSSSSSFQHTSRKHLAALAIAVMVACPAVQVSRADETADMQQIALKLVEMAPTNQELLQKALQELQGKNYEEALAALQQVQPDQTWGDQEKTNLSDLIAQASKGVEGRKQARADFERGEAALAAGNSSEALAAYKAASDNPFADDGTRAKSLEQMAVAENNAKAAQVDYKAMYSQAEADFKAGNLTDAKAKFETLAAANFKPGWFKRSPQDYISDINKQQAAKDAQAAATQNLPPESVQQAAANTTETPSAAPVDAKAAYKLAKDQYKKGDWINARKNFEIAQAAGYKPGLFEDSPAKYLSRMDAKELADNERHVREIEAARAREAEALAAAQPTPPPTDVAQATPPTTAEMTPPVAPTDTPPQVAQATPTEPTPATETAPVTPTDAAPATAITPTPTEQLQKTADIERIRAEENASEARKLVEEGRKAEEAGNLQGAFDLYARALTLDANNSDAIAGRDRLVAPAGRQAGQGGLLDQRAKDIETQRQIITYSFNVALDEQDKSIGEQRFTDAQNAISRARAAREQNPSIFSPDELGAFDRRLADAQARLDQARATAQAQDAKIQEEKTQAEIRDKERLAAERKKEAIANLIKRSRQLTAEGRYDEALAVVDQILVLDKNNDYATGVRPLIYDRKLFRDQRKYNEEFDRAFTEQLNLNEERKIPYSDILRFPENWPDLSTMRDDTVRQERGEEKEDAQVQAQLDRKLPELRFDGVPFADVVDFLRDVSGSNIFVNWKALETAGVDKNAPVTARLRDVRFSKALNTVLQEVGGGADLLGYTIDDGVITISTKEDLGKNATTRVYDIRDLIVQVPDFDQAPDFNITQNNTPTSGGGGGGGGGGQGLFGGGGGGGGGQGNEDSTSGATRAELIEQIISLIRDTVDTNSWKENGGSVGAVRELNGQLIVTQTPENQRALVQLLSQLRETRAIQVSIETRFLRVQRNFLEDIGVDFDFQFNGLDDRITGSNITGGTRNGAIGFLQNSSNFTQASTLDTTLPGNLSTVLSGSAISTAVSFIDDFQVSALVRATQASQNSTTITAPRVTLFNGQRAYVLVATTRAYVSDLNPIVGSGAVGFDPTISSVQSGVLLDVQATVSSDRKYVTLTLRPQLSQLIQLVPFSTGDTQVFGNGTDTSTQPFSGSGVIQQPEIQITEVRTTVSVPDGGTLLLGGQTLSGEIERESGVPVLSKIPIIKRLFTNRAMAKDDQILLILVKPTIIIQREQEQKQFPLLTQSVR
jgi:general secretion pathway protein D